MKPVAARLPAHQVGWLLLSLIIVMVPHAQRVPWWVTVVASMLLAWRLYITYYGLNLPRKWLLFAITAAAIGGIYLSYGRILGRDSGVTLLLIMLTLKLLEMSTVRDAMVLIFISYFIVITNFLYSQTVPNAVYLLGAVWLITATMIGFQYRVRQAGYKTRMRMAGVMLLQATPLMVALFLLFPRIQGPIWGLPQDAYAGMTGLSDEMSPGSVSRLIGSDAIAFRVNFTGRIPAVNQLYWRGPVMWDFDGYTWTVPRASFVAQREYQALDKPIEYSVTVEPHGKRWLFALELPANVPPRTLITSDFQLLYHGNVTNRVRYDIGSHLSYRNNSVPSGTDRSRALFLPGDANPRTRELATRMRREAANERAYVSAVLSMFRNQNFYYTTTPPLLATNSMDEFLFTTKAGFCEHYASAFVIMMRAAGIPARVVTGYQGGEINTVGNYLTVRQADAHAWGEVWLDGDGWTRVDPTAAVSPARVEAGVGAAVPQSEVLPSLLRGEFAWVRRARMTWDSVANSWNQLVLGYTQERQRQLMRHVGIDDATWKSLITLMIAVTALIMFALAAVMLYKLRDVRRDPATIAYARFCSLLARRGISRHPSEGPDSFRKRAQAARPDLGAAIDAISELYIRLRYGNAPQPEDALRLKQQVATFRP